MKIAITFINFGTYHFARLRAANAECEARGWRMTAIQATDDPLDHPWGYTPGGERFPIVTLLSAKEHGERARDAAFTNQVGERMTRQLNELRPDVLFLPGWSHPSARAGLQWCLRNRSQAVVMSESTKHDFQRSWWREAYKAFLVRACDAALVGGEPHRAYLEELGMSRESIFLGYDVVDNDYFARAAALARQNGATVRRELDLPERYFLASSRFIEKKNLLRLIAAFEGYRRRAGADAWHLVILGDGDLRDQLEGAVQDRGLADVVRMPGFATYDQVPRYLGLAEAFVHASTSEQWGLVVNEAMAAGLPVLVSNRCGCAQDLVAPSENGYQFDPFKTEEMESLLFRLWNASPAERVRMGEQSCARIAAWSPARFGRSVVDASSYAHARATPGIARHTKHLLLASTFSLSGALAPKMRGA